MNNMQFCIKVKLKIAIMHLYEYKNALMTQKSPVGTGLGRKYKKGYLAVYNASFIFVALNEIKRIISEFDVWVVKLTV